MLVVVSVLWCGDWVYCEIKTKWVFSLKTTTTKKGRDITLPTKIHLLKAMIFSNSYIWMWELDHKEGWALKNWCFWIVVLEKTLESPLDCKEIKPINPKGNQPWIFIERTDTEAPVLWPPDSKSQLIGKHPDAGKRLKAGGEGDDRRWGGWMASLTQWIWAWTNSRRQWKTGKPGVLQSLGLWRVRHNLATEQQEQNL